MTDYQLNYHERYDNYSITAGEILFDKIYRMSFPQEETDVEFKKRAIERFDTFIEDKRSYINGKLIKSDVA